MFWSRMCQCRSNKQCSQNEIYDIGTKILLLSKNCRTSTHNAPKSIIFSGICSILPLDSEFAIKTRFKALSFSKIDLLGFAAIVFLWIFAPGGRLSKGLYNRYFFDTFVLYFGRYFWRSPAPCKPKRIERKKYETLSSSSKNFERDTYKGGRRPKAAAPLCRSSLSQIVQTGA